jgi:hypothetical protein
MSIDYNVIEDMKKMKANVSIFYINSIHQQRDLILQTFKTSPNVSHKTMENCEAKHNPYLVKSNFETKQKATLNDVVIGNHSKPQTPPFSPTFENFNHNVHNCLVDSRASPNIIHFLVCNKIHTTIEHALNSNYPTR